MKVYKNIFQSIISPENLFDSWDVFRKDKRNKPDIMDFERRLEQHLFTLHHDVRDKTYRHGSYEPFWICDPKRRLVHKATVRDRVLHHAIFQVLNPIFEPVFIQTSFSCRVGKGTHRGFYSVESMVRKESRNYTRACFVLKCDVQKFFDSVDHEVLFALLQRKIKDGKTLWLLREVIESYASPCERERERERE